MLCETCGRRPSERHKTPYCTCYDPIHDAADAGPEALAAVQKLTTALGLILDCEDTVLDSGDRAQGCRAMQCARALLAKLDGGG